MTDADGGDTRTSSTAPSLRHTVGRTPGDFGVIVVSAAAVATAALTASVIPASRAERDLLEFFNHLPPWVGVVLQPAVVVGSALSIGVLAGLALFVRYVRLGAGMAVAGTLGWVATWVVGQFVDRPVPAGFLADVSLRGVAAAGPEPFPSSHVAVIVALGVVVRPYVGPGTRRVLVWVAAIVAAGVLHVGAALPLAVATGAVVGWWAGATANVLVGAPGRRVGPRLVAAVLRDAGQEPTSVRHLRGRPWAAAEFSAETADGERLLVRVVRRGVRRLGRLDRLRRWVASADVAHESGLADAQQQVDHEALVGLLSARAGARVPRVRVARELPGGAALLATEVVEGTALSELTPGDVPDALLDDVWQQVACLRRERVVHHGLSPETVLVDPAGRAWLTHFASGRVGARDDALLEDVAELLAGLATLVGAERAVDAAVRVLGRDVVASAARQLQPLTLPRHVRAALDDRPDVLAAVRSRVAEHTGTEVVDVGIRVRPTTVLGLLVAGGAVYVVLPQVGSLDDLVGALRGASWGWLAVAFAVGMLSAPAAALSYWGSTRRPVPLGGLTAVQLASTFTGRLTPGSVGGIGLNMLYLERAGLTRTEAASAVTLNAAGGVVVHAGLFTLAALQIGLASIRQGLQVPTGWPVLAAVAVVLVAAGVALGTPLGRRRVVRPAMEMSRTLIDTVRHPGRASALLGGSALVTVANALAFLATIHAFGIQGPSTLQVVAVYVGGAAIAAAAPTPGGLGAVEAALVAALASVGVASTVAVAAVLSFRLLTFWIPILPGMVAYRLLQHHEVV